MKICIQELHPTQISVGYEQVEEKAQRLTNMKNAKLKDYLRDHSVPVIIGYDNKFFIIDHHHLCFAADKIGISEVYYNIVKDLSHLSYNEFWVKMHEEKYIWTYDEKGRELPLSDFPHLLPGSIRGLKNDPYRSIAGLLRKEGVFTKEWTPFSEFQWANFIRSHIHVPDDSIEIPHEVLERAHNICRSKLAAHLPGYIAA